MRVRVRPTAVAVTPSCDGRPPLCVVCGVDKRLVPANSRVKSKPTIRDFLCFHGVIAEERFAVWADPCVCEFCHNAVSRCDEFYFAFCGELERLARKASSYDTRVGDPLSLVDSRIVQRQQQQQHQVLQKETFSDGSWNLSSETNQSSSADEKPRPGSAVLQSISEATTGGIFQDSYDVMEYSVGPEEAVEDASWTFSNITEEESPTNAFGGTSSQGVLKEEMLMIATVSVKMEANADEEAATSLTAAKNVNDILQQPAEGTSLAGNDRLQEVSSPTNNSNNNNNNNKPPLGELRRCKYCYFRTRNETSLNAHVVLKHKDILKTGRPTVYACPKCSETFRSQQTLETHTIQEHRPVEQRVHPCVLCVLCDRAFTNAKLLSAHEEEEHPTSMGKATCEHCGQQMFQRQYSRHLATQHKIRVDIFTCEFCGATRSGKKALKRHLARDHGIGEYRKPKVFPCPECDKRLTSKEFFYTHLYARHQIERPELAQFKFTCDQCGKVVVGKNNFQGHMKLHSGERYVCPLCDYKTRFLGNFTSHRKTMHGYVPCDPRDTNNTSAPGFEYAAARFLKRPEEYLPAAGGS